MLTYAIRKPKSDTKYRVAIIGCGRMGQNYAEAYTTYPDTKIVAIANTNAQRREVLGARFGHVMCRKRRNQR